MTKDDHLDKADKLLWWIVGVLLSVIILGGTAWATAINAKVEKIASMETNIQYIQSDVKDIKEIIKGVLKNKGDILWN